MKLLKTSYNAEITEIDGKIPGITSLATTSALNAAEKRYPTTVIWSTSKVKDIEIKYFNTSDYNK